MNQPNQINLGDGPKDKDGQILGSVDDDFDLVIPLPLDEFENEYHETTYDLDRQEISHP